MWKKVKLAEEFTAGTVNSSIAAAVRNRQMFDLFV